jgi:hypothetical protein
MSPDYVVLLTLLFLIIMYMSWIVYMLFKRSNKKNPYQIREVRATFGIPSLFVKDVNLKGGDNPNCNHLLRKTSDHFQDTQETGTHNTLWFQYPVECVECGAVGTAFLEEDV